MDQQCHACTHIGGPIRVHQQSLPQRPYHQEEPKAREGFLGDVTSQLSPERGAGAWATKRGWVTQAGAQVV